jgi:8-oxo-dGTP diphosphatase
VSSIEVRVSSGVFISGSQILLSQRSEQEHVPFKWQFPGGKAEPGESDESALHREIREELGIEILESTEIGRSIARYTPHEMTSITFYLIASYNGEIVQAEGQRLRWVDLCEPIPIDVIDANRHIFSLMSQRLCPHHNFAWERVWATHSEEFSSPGTRIFRVREKLLALKAIGFEALDGDRILDVGCGSHASTLIHEVFDTSASVKVIGIDRSWSALTATKSSGANDITLLNADATRLPIASSAVNKILVLNVLEHLKDGRAFLSELRRTLSPGGEIYFSQSNLLSLIAVDRLTRQWRHDWPYGYQKNYTPKQLKKTLEEHFSVEAMEIRMPHKNAPIYRAIDTAIHTGWKDWGRNIFVRARRAID